MGLSIWIKLFLPRNPPCFNSGFYCLSFHLFTSLLWRIGICINGIGQKINVDDLCTCCLWLFYRGWTSHYGLSTFLQLDSFMGQFKELLLSLCLVLKPIKRLSLSIAYFWIARPGLRSECNLFLLIFLKLKKLSDWAYLKVIFLALAIGSALTKVIVTTFIFFFLSLSELIVYLS